MDKSWNQTLCGFLGDSDTGRNVTRSIKFPNFGFETEKKKKKTFHPPRSIESLQIKNGLTNMCSFCRSVYDVEVCYMCKKKANY